MLDSFHSCLADLKTEVSDELQEMCSLITDKSNNSNVSYISQIVNHLILAGGKRVRPAMLLASCKMLGCFDKRKIKVAAAVEFIHSATLLHDDVVDRSNLRRGVHTSNYLWGNKPSILVGDFLFAVAFQWVVSCNSIPLVSVLSEASSIIISGEIQQMVHSTDISLTRDKYTEIISAKTAALFSAACEAAAVLHDAPNEHRNALKCFGYNFGMVFQILDDILDYSAKKDTLGKNPGQDLVDKKVTLPLIMTLESVSSEDRKHLQDILTAPEDTDFDTVFSYIEGCNALEESREFAIRYAIKAVESLSVFPESLYKTKILNLINSAVSRQY